jgi:hypothetical protein
MFFFFLEDLISFDLSKNIFYSNFIILNNSIFFEIEEKYFLSCDFFISMRDLKLNIYILTCLRNKRLCYFLFKILLYLIGNYCRNNNNIIFYDFFINYVNKRLSFTYDKFGILMIYICIFLLFFFLIKEMCLNNFFDFVRLINFYCAFFFKVRLPFALDCDVFFSINLNYLYNSLNFFNYNTFLLKKDFFVYGCTFAEIVKNISMKIFKFFLYF